MRMPLPVQQPRANAPQRKNGAPTSSPSAETAASSLGRRSGRRRGLRKEVHPRLVHSKSNEGLPLPLPLPLLLPSEDAGNSPGGHATCEGRSPSDASEPTAPDAAGIDEPPREQEVILARKSVPRSREAHFGQVGSLEALRVDQLGNGGAGRGLFADFVGVREGAPAPSESRQRREGEAVRTIPHSQFDTATPVKFPLSTCACACACACPFSSLAPTLPSGRMAFQRARPQPRPQRPRSGGGEGSEKKSIPDWYTRGRTRAFLSHSSSSSRAKTSATRQEGTQPARAVRPRTRQNPQLQTRRPSLPLRLRLRLRMPVQQPRANAPQRKNGIPTSSPSAETAASSLGRRSGRRRGLRREVNPRLVHSRANEGRPLPLLLLLPSEDAGNSPGGHATCEEPLSAPARDKVRV